MKEGREEGQAENKDSEYWASFPKGQHLDKLSRPLASQSGLICPSLFRLPSSLLQVFASLTSGSENDQ